jgi:hypothetical protein
VAQASCSGGFLLVPARADFLRESNGGTKALVICAAKGIFALLYFIIGVQSP